MSGGRTWTSRSLGSKSGHQFFYWAIRLGGRRPAYFFLYFVVFYYVVFHPAVKDKTEPYLSRRFPDSGLFKRFFQRYRFSLHLGKALIDRAVFGICKENSIRISFERDDDLVRLKALNGGFVILMSHVGGWQVVMSALSALGKPVNLLMLREEQDIDKHYFEHGQGKAPFNIISPEQFLGGAIEMLNALKNDEILCIMGDRVFKSSELAIDMEFLGGRVRFPVSAFKIASIAQKAVVVLYSQKTGPADYRLTIPEIIHIPGKLGKNVEKFRPYVQRFVISLEQYTRRYPYQFFNFYDMWEADETKTNSFFKAEGHN